jgi:hypothetical protein
MRLGTASKRSKLFLKAFHAVMLVLIRYVRPRRFDAGLADGKCSVSALPMKSFEFSALGFDPFGGGAFNFHDDVGQRTIFAQLKQNMNVVAPRIHRDHTRTEIEQDGCGVGAERPTNRIGKEWFAILGAEDQMYQVFG